MFYGDLRRRLYAHDMLTVYGTWEKMCFDALSAWREQLRGGWQADELLLYTVS